MSVINFGLEVPDSMMKRDFRRGNSAATSHSDVPSLAPVSTSIKVPSHFEILGGRVILLDLGHSFLEPVQKKRSLQQLKWIAVLTAQRETQAGLILLCGARDEMRHTVPPFFREWSCTTVRTDGSIMMSLAYPDHWEMRRVADRDEVDLEKNRKALCLEVRRPGHPWMTLVMLKLHLTPCSTGVWLDTLTRNKIWNAVTDKLKKSNHWLLAAAPEADITSVLNRLSCINTDTQATGSPESHLQFMASGGINLASATTASSHVEVEQCLVLEIGVSAADVKPVDQETSLRPTKKARLSNASDDPRRSSVQPPGFPSRSSVQLSLSKKRRTEAPGNDQGTKPVFTLRDARSCMMRALREADEAGTDLPSFLFLPRAKLVWDPRDGSILVPASSRRELERTFEIAANLMDAARKKGAWASDDAILDKKQFDWAYDWLKELYMEKFGRRLRRCTTVPDFSGRPFERGTRSCLHFLALEEYPISSWSYVGRTWRRNGVPRCLCALGLHFGVQDPPQIDQE